ncbi:dolichyl-diphosphooligosaccharide--protein glycosyltransferase subunit 1B-like isoform X2 [Gossypium australe]|uniref:Dolichyl-diphosphooligosaccharide--protein glycosyltransferase subunit 1 n=1 Tax=Gossypium australe TaxID=47621 RepID=A0A5B6WIM5_9ROSI|nr:dolichyl-diphosphooligosaccharide--protein glycosyltransferase subunit 1B-like isoform X2 [Gossypium australe]
MGFDSFPLVFHRIQHTFRMGEVSSFMIMHLHLNVAFAIIPVEAKSELEIEPRYPLFGGWKATFVIGYGLPLQDFLFESSDDKRYLNFTFGCPLIGMVVDKLTIKVVLPEGSTDPSPVVPFPVEHRLEVVIPNITLSVSHNLVHLQSFEYYVKKCCLAI